MSSFLYKNGEWVDNWSDSNGMHYGFYAPNGTNENTKIVVASTNPWDYNYWLKHIQEISSKDTAYLVIPSIQDSYDTPKAAQDFADVITSFCNQYDIPTENVYFYSWSNGTKGASVIASQLGKNGNNIGGFINLFGNFDGINSPTFFTHSEALNGRPYIYINNGSNQTNYDSFKSNCENYIEIKISNVAHEAYRDVNNRYNFLNYFLNEGELTNFDKINEIIYHHDGINEVITDIDKLNELISVDYNLNYEERLQKAVLRTLDLYKEKVVCDNEYIQTSIQDIFNAVIRVDDSIRISHFGSSTRVPTEENDYYRKIQIKYLNCLNNYLYKDLKKIIAYGSDQKKMDEEMSQTATTLGPGSYNGGYSYGGGTYQVVNNPVTIDSSNTSTANDVINNETPVATITPSIPDVNKVNNNNSYSSNINSFSSNNMSAINNNSISNEQTIPNDIENNNDIIDNDFNGETNLEDNTKDNNSTINSQIINKSQKHKTNKLKDLGLAMLAGGAVAGGVYGYKKIKENQEENDNLDDDLNDNFDDNDDEI